MRVYLELIEITEVEEPDFIRVDVTEWDPGDVEEAVRLLREHAEGSYASYVLQRHFCYHEEGLPCITEILASKG